MRVLIPAGTTTYPRCEHSKVQILHPQIPHNHFVFSTNRFLIISASPLCLPYKRNSIHIIAFYFAIVSFRLLIPPYTASSSIALEPFNHELSLRSALGCLLQIPHKLLRTFQSPLPDSFFKGGRTSSVLVAPMSLTIFLALCILGLDFMIYVLFMWLYGDRRALIARRVAEQRKAAQAEAAGLIIFPASKSAPVHREPGEATCAGDSGNESGILLSHSSHTTRIA